MADLLVPVSDRGRTIGPGGRRRADGADKSADYRARVELQDGDEAMALSQLTATPQRDEALGVPEDPAGPEDERRLAWLTSGARRLEEPPHRYLLLLRFTLINLLAGALLAVAVLQGWVAMVWYADYSRISAAIAVVFVGGLVLAGYRTWQTSCDLNHIRDFDPLVPSLASTYLSRIRGLDEAGRANIAQALRIKLSQRIAAVRHLAGSLVLLGLIGTVVGFIIALSGVDPTKADQVDAIAPMVSTMIAGLSTALYTTLVGAVLNLWLMMNYRLLAGGTGKLITALLEEGERHGRA